MAIVRCRRCWWPVDAGAKTCPKCGARIREPVPILAIVLGGLLVVLGLISLNRNQSEPPPADPEPDAIKNLYFDYRYATPGGPGSSMYIDWVIFTNKGRHDVKDIVFACDEISESGTLAGTYTAVVPQTVRASKNMRVEQLYMGVIDRPVRRIRCNVRDLKIILSK